MTKPLHIKKIKPLKAILVSPGTDPGGCIPVR